VTGNAASRTTGDRQMNIYEIEFKHEGIWYFHHQHSCKSKSEHDAEEYSRLLTCPFRVRLRTPEEEYQLTNKVQKIRT
jgi:hypothetical protein